MARQMFQKSHVQRRGSGDESFYLRLFKPVSTPVDSLSKSEQWSQRDASRTFRCSGQRMRRLAKAFNSAWLPAMSADFLACVQRLIWRTVRL